MNRSALALLLVCLTLSPSAAAAQEPHAKEPEYVNTFFVLGTDGALTPLEGQTATLNTRTKALGWGGGSVAYHLVGERSTVRFLTSATLQFVVRPQGMAFGGGPSADVDPATIVGLYSLTRARGRRELEIARGGGLGGMQLNRQTTAAVPIDIVKYGERSVVITPVGPLQPGEYMLISNTGMAPQQAYGFGVDAGVE